MINEFKIKTAVIPIAGLGTRFLPVTRSVPKVLLPVLDTPIIEYAVREVVSCGITNIIFVMNRNMNIVKEYFDKKTELLNSLKKSNNLEEFKRQEEISNLANIEIVYQDEPLGLGHAILQSKTKIDSEYFLVVLPDDLIFNKVNASNQILNVHNKFGGMCIGLKEIPKEEISHKGIVDGNLIEKNIYSLNNLIEKPEIENAPSNLSIIGRYILNTKIFELIKNQSPGALGEIQITDAIKNCIEYDNLYGKLLEGKHFDAGNPNGMLEASVFVSKKTSTNSF